MYAGFNHESSWSYFSNPIICAAIDKLLFAYYLVTVCCQINTLLEDDRSDTNQRSHLWPIADTLQLPQETSILLYEFMANIHAACNDYAAMIYTWHTGKCMLTYRGISHSPLYRSGFAKRQFILQKRNTTNLRRRKEYCASHSQAIVRRGGASTIIVLHFY